MIKGIIGLILDLYSILLLIRILFSFATINVANTRQNNFIMIIKKLTDPPLKPFQRMIGPVQVGTMYLDFAPLIVLLIINILQNYFIK